MPGNPWLEFLESAEEGPRINFYSRLPQNQTFNQQRFGEDLYNNMWTGYLGAVGRQVRGGGAPTLQYGDYLDQNMNFNRSFRAAPQFQTGMQTNRLSPFTRYLYFR